MTRAAGWVLGCLVLAACQPLAAEEPAARPSARAAEAIALLDSRDPHQREVAFLRLEALREPATIEVVRKYLTDHDPEARASGVRALAAIQGVEAVPALLEQLETEKHPRVRRALLLALEPVAAGDPAVLPVFIKSLRDRDTQVRMTAVDIVSRIDDPRAREAVRERHKREGRRDVRRVLEQAMKRIGGDG